jgi:hypothetical protein
VYTFGIKEDANGPRFLATEDAGHFGDGGVPHV